MSTTFGSTGRSVAFLAIASFAVGALCFSKVGAVAPSSPTQAASGGSGVSVSAGQPVIGERLLQQLNTDHFTPVEAALSNADVAEQVILNNLSNSLTQGFKRSSVIWHSGGKIQTVLDFTQGATETTNNPLDIALEGPGFFHIKIKDSIGDGTAYTRNGAFFVNNEGELVLGLGDGNKLIPSITIPSGVAQKDITIGEDGTVSVRLPGLANTQVIGQLEITNFVNPQGLETIDAATFVETEASGQATRAKPGEYGAGKTRAGFLEGSNVDPRREQRGLDAIQRLRTTLTEASRLH